MLRLALGGAAVLSVAAADPSSIEGLWRSPGGNSIMEISGCGDATCGTVAWASDKARRESSEAAPQLVGTTLLTHLERAKDGSWRGKLFIPDKNMHVIARIRRVSDQELVVWGCAIVCRSDIWTAFAQALPEDTSRPAPK